MKKRPLFSLCLSLLGGMYALSVIHSQMLINLALVCLVAVFVYAFRKRNIAKIILPVLMIVCFLAGMVRYQSADNIMSRHLYMYNNTIVRTTAEVLSVPEKSENSISYIANIYSVTNGENTSHMNEKVRFVYYIDAEDEEVTLPILGDVVILEGEIKIPKDSMNSGGFDYSRYLKTENIFFVCEIENEEIVIAEHKNRFLKHKIENFRYICMSFFDERFPVEEAGLLKAFVLGDNSAITEKTDIAFTKSGLMHILAVSGLHVSVFLSVLALMLKKLKVSKRKEMFICAVSAIIFVLFTGASTSATRAGTMIVLALVAKLLYRKADPLTSLSMAGAVMALFNPFVIYDCGFMLSFSATAGIILFYDDICAYISKVCQKAKPASIWYKQLYAICNSIAVGISAQIFTIPILIYVFNGFSLMSSIATLVVTQILKPLLICGLLFIFVSLISAKIAWLISLPLFCLARIMLYIAEFFSKIPFSYVLYGVLTPFTVSLYALFVSAIISIIKKKKAMYIISITSLCILSVFGFINYRTHLNTASVSFLNVGQGDCALVKAPGDCDILIDAGGYSLNEKTGEYTISPYLLKNGVTDIEYIMISHIDIDHTIGLSGILKTHKVEKIIIPYGHQYCEGYVQIEELAKDYGIEILMFSKGDSLMINDKMTIEAITPEVEQYKYSHKSNDTGMVLRLDYGESSFLFSGDISSIIEKHLLNEKANLDDIDVLKVAHHGSKNSTCQEFVDVVDPDYAFISVGTNNFGHPNQGVIERLTENGADVYISALDKDVTFYFDEYEIKGVKCKNTTGE